MKNEIIQIPEDTLFVKLERLQYELDSHKDLLSWLFAQNVQNTLVTKYMTEYNDIFKEYQVTKQQFEDEFIAKHVHHPEKSYNWRIHFTTREVVIEYLNE